MAKSNASRTGPKQTDTAMVAQELSRLRQCSDDERAVLARLQHQVGQAAADLKDGRSAQLVEANERLVLAMAHAQSIADSTAKTLEEALRVAGHDPLTALPNRLLMLDRLAQAIAHARRHDVHLAVLYLDLDNFKQINDDLGHAIGDEVLGIMGQRLVACVRATDTVSRHGGDEFLILLSEVADIAEAVQVAEKAGAAIAAPIRSGAHALQLTASIGISVYPDDGDDAQTLIDRADAVMYRAKRSGGGVVCEGQAMVDAPPSMPQAKRPAPTHHDLLNTQMQEANGRLIGAAIGAQELHAAATRAHRQQHEFLAVIAHELRNPLALIRRAASMRQPGEAHAALEARRIIDQEVQQMTRLVDGLLDISQVKTGKLRLQSQVLDMAALIGHAVDGCRPRIQAHRQSLAVRIPAQPLSVYGDKIRLLQVFTNLLDHASTNTSEGGEIVLRVEVVEDVAVTTVSDGGIGNAVDALPQALEPLAENNQARNFNDSVIGVGLIILRELVEAHGGTVVETSAGIDSGGQFVVSLPLTSAPAPAANR